MNTRERLDKTESDLRSIDKRVWFLTILVAIFMLKDGNGALMSVITGTSVSEVNAMIEPTIFIGIAAAAGSAFRAWLGYVDKYKKKGIDFDWSMFLISVIPTTIAGLAAGMGFDLELNFQNVILVFLGAAGVNSLQDKFGLQKQK